MSRRPRNLLADLPPDRGKEEVEEIFRRGPVRIERIVSRGQSSPPGFWYNQEEDEWVLLVAGRAALEVRGQDRLVELGPGDHLLLPAHCEHRVAWTSRTEATVWLAVFSAP